MSLSPTPKERDAVFIKGFNPTKVNKIGGTAVKAG
jgi:hypothetical protein